MDTSARSKYLEACHSIIQPLPPCPLLHGPPSHPVLAGSRLGAGRITFFWVLPRVEIPALRSFHHVRAALRLLMGREEGVERGWEWESLSLSVLLAPLAEIFPFSHQSPHRGMATARM